MLLLSRATATVRTAVASSLRTSTNAKRTIITMAPLPYEQADGVLPLITPKSLDLHYNKICAGYCETANSVVQGTQLDKMDPLALITRAKVDAQNSLIIVPGGSLMSVEMEKLVCANFGSVDELKRRFNRYANSTFSNGWTFLVVRDGRLEVMNCRDGATPYGETNTRPVACIDLWEHAYLPDFQYRRSDYINRYWDVFDWKSLEDRINEELPEIW